MALRVLAIIQFCLSVTLLSPIKTVQARITKSSLWAVPRTLAFNDNIPIVRGRQIGVPPKRRYFAAVGSYIVKTVADRYRLAAYRNKHW